jgi:hypothetical protein
MGGTVFVGIRRGDGSEHLYECWTNSIPWWFANPDFVTDGSGVDEFIRLAEERVASGESIYTKRHHSVTYSEYGVILIDFIEKKILSCQGYCTPGQMTTFWHGGISATHSPDEVEAVLKLHKAGRLSHFEGTHTFEVIPKDEERRIIAMLEKATDGRIEEHVTLSIVVHTDLSDFELADHMNCGKKERALVRSFLIDNGWKARVHGQRKK